MGNRYPRVHFVLSNRPHLLENSRTHFKTPKLDVSVHHRQIRYFLSSNRLGIA